NPPFARTYTGPLSLRPTSTAAVREVRFVDDFVAQLEWAIGLVRRRPVSVVELNDPDRLVIDIG
ncbi:MAG: AMIN-like domain-containing (lipo)protein, partial [Acidimicrobiales bacterium]